MFEIQTNNATNNNWGKPVDVPYEQINESPTNDDQKNVKKKVKTKTATRRRRKQRQNRLEPVNLSTDCSLDVFYTDRRKTKKTQTDYGKESSTLKAVKKSGLVNAQINVFEKNLNSPDKKRKKANLAGGVPLVGMHNGYPTAYNYKKSKSPSPSMSYWYNREVRKSFNRRKAPTETNFYLEHKIRSRSRASLGRKSCNGTKFIKNPYLSGKSGQICQIREISKVMSTAAIKTKSKKHDKNKRRTLYAKDMDGDEAIKVLSNLCLNPLARTSKRSSFMIW